jgi:hypothetical protein
MGLVTATLGGLLRSVEGARRSAGQRRRRWVRQTIEAELRDALHEDLSPIQRGTNALSVAASEPMQPRGRLVLGVVTAYFAVLLVGVLVADWLEPTILPALRPLLSEDGLTTTWQVQAALVAAALPFLFVLIPLVRNEALALQRTAQVLMADTWIYPILVFSLAGALWIGISVVWFQNDASRWLAFALVLVPSAVGVGYAYLSAARIIANPDHVRGKSMKLMQAIADDALVEQRGQAYANGELLDCLRPYQIEKQDLFSTPEGAVPVTALRDGVLADVDTTSLSKWLHELGNLASGVTEANYLQADAQPAEFIPPTEGPYGWWAPLIGDKVKVGGPVILIRPGGVDASLIPQLEAGLDRCLLIPDDE